ncbi:hypothetical protein [Spirillospora sp. NPDC047279]|uniref:hypothetical protein n=1 Tax=Spirillospora sp. NPDC047279 TaxID=3155478 RepID=UPI0033C4D254
MTLASNLRENKAVYTVIGGGDFAAEKVRELPEQVTKYQGEFRETAAKYRGQVREIAAKYQGELRETAAKYRGEARGAAGKVQDRVEVKDLPGAAVAYVTHVGTRTVEFIDELAERGKKVVHREAEEVAEITEAKPAPAPKAKAAQQKKTAQSKATTAAKKTDA